MDLAEVWNVSIHLTALQKKEAGDREAPIIQLSEGYQIYVSNYQSEEAIRAGRLLVRYWGGVLRVKCQVMDTGRGPAQPTLY